MTRDLKILLAAQFATAFSDNAVLFVAVAMAQQASAGPWYIPAIQAAFLVAFVVLAPWVGPFADQRPKALVLTWANLVKCAGAVLMLLQLDPLLAYAAIGAGAAMYSPAKYGILPELVPHDQLVKANSWIEASTILAILLGAVVGASVADHSIGSALAMVVGLYAISALAALFISRATPVHQKAGGGQVKAFLHTSRRLLSSSRARFATLGISLFWSAGAVLRVALVAWAPAVLLIDDAAGIAKLTLFSAVGIAIGAALAPRIVPMSRLRRARLAAYGMGAAILCLGAVSSHWMSWLVLLVVGIAGGLLVVPINAALQDIGHKTVGSGGAVAVQHFFENAAMLAGVGIYGLAAQGGVDPITPIVVLGVAVILATLLISWRLPPDPYDRVDIDPE